jgi:thimet oligopeptidase
MRRAFAVAAAALAAALPAARAAPSPEAPLAPLYEAPALERACAEGLARVRKSIDAMAARKGGGGIVAQWNRLFIEQEDAVNVASLYASIHPDKAVRDAAEACDQKFTSLNTELNQNQAIYARLVAARPANPRQAKLLRDLLKGFEDSGAALPPDKRARAKALFDKIDEHRIEFERNVREDPTKVTFTPAEMQGLPEAYLKSRKRDAAGNYVLGLDQVSYGPFMGNAKSGAARERYYRARFGQGGAKNLDHLEQLFILRQELAGLYGLPSYAAYILRRRMAGSPEAVERFLADVHAAILPVEKRELDELRAEKAKEQGGDPAATPLQLWDMAYYAEKVRRARYDVDQEKLRPYFPSDKAVEFVLAIAERLYGVKFREDKVPAWHPDVRYFEMRDAKTDRYLGNLYLDLFPRDGKRPGAFAAPLRSASRLEHRTPSGALVANLDRQGLNQRELEVLLHEFGHALNLILSNVDYAPQALATVKWDFVEAPSQMFEEWARREQTLALFKEVCPQCPHLTGDEIRRLDEARRFGQAMGYGRQWLLAALDMELSTRPRPPLAVWKELESATPLGHVEGTMFPASFNHIAGGYASGYYGYMWSRVVARDLLSAFGDNLLDPAVGARYRATILGVGNEAEEADMVRRFLGREPSSDAFFAEITGR